VSTICLDASDLLRYEREAQILEVLNVMPEPFAENRVADTEWDAAKAPIIIGKKIREAILDGTYQPGARLTEVELAEKFEMSRSPVREALQALVKEGTLEAAPYRGALVKPLRQIWLQTSEKETITDALKLPQQHHECCPRYV
jgi:DNA-binding FadR family transcriptional regulator